MPHFYAKNKKQLTFPIKKDDFIYEFIAKGNNNDLIFVKFEDISFFLTEIDFQDKFLVKGDKNTRPPQAKILQKALRSFASIRYEEIISSNIEPKKEKEAKTSPFLKNIEYFADNFYAKNELWIEIGFGSGRHLLNLANLNPDIQFIGIEIHKPSISQVLRQIELQELKNIIILNYDARIFMEFLPKDSVGRIFIHFPVPWDKKPHRRVVSDEFLKIALNCLKENGSVEVRTDSDEYANYCYEVFTKPKFSSLEIRKNFDLAISSKYEDRWKRQNKDIFDLIFTNEQFITNQNSNLDVSSGGFDFSINFPESINIDRLKTSFTKRTLKNENSFVNFEDLYKIDENTLLIKMSFGGFEKPDKKYLLIKQKEIYYLPSSPIPSVQNISAHSLICSYFAQNFSGKIDE